MKIFALDDLLLEILLADANMESNRLSPVLVEPSWLAEGVFCSDCVRSLPFSAAKRESTVILEVECGIGVGAVATAADSTGVGSILAKSLSNSEASPDAWPCGGW